MGKVNYYKKFVPGFALHAAPLFELMKEKNHVLIPQRVKDPDVIEAFKKTRETLCQAPVLAYPDFNSKEPFILDTDWSKDPGCIGAVLSQVQDGQERVICYGARKLSGPATNYSSNKGELLAVIEYMRKWKYFLAYQPFILRADHSALRLIKTMEMPKG